MLYLFEVSVRFGFIANGGCLSGFGKESGELEVLKDDGSTEELIYN